MLERRPETVCHSAGPSCETFNVDHLSSQNARKPPSIIEVKFQRVRFEELFETPREVASFKVPVGQHDDTTTLRDELLGDRPQRLAMMYQNDSAADSELAQGQAVALSFNDDNGSRLPAIDAE